MGRPASSTSVRSPSSVSSFAAHPPVIPDPTTIASYSGARRGMVQPSRAPTGAQPSYRVGRGHAPSVHVVVESRQHGHLVALGAVGEVLSVAGAAPPVELAKAGEKPVALVGI